MTTTTFVEVATSNRRRSALLMVLTFLVLFGFVNLIAAAFGAYTRSSNCDRYGSCSTSWWWNPVTLIVSGAIVAGYLWIAYLSASRAALSITQATPATGPEYQRLRNVVEGVAIAAGIPAPSVYVIDDSAPNAFATGMRPDKAAVVVTTGLLALMSRRELEGVLAHEISHIRNRDSSYMTLVVLTVGAIVVLSDILIRIGLMAGAFGGGRRRNQNDNAGLALLAIGLLGLVVAVPFSLLLKAAVSRRREALADASAVELTRNPTGIRSALEKLEADTTVVRATSAATAHLWIESPLERREGSGLAGTVGRLFDSHPPLADRIGILRKFEGLDPDARGPVDPRPSDHAEHSPAPTPGSGRGRWRPPVGLPERPPPPPPPPPPSPPR